MNDEDLIGQLGAVLPDIPAEAVALQRVRAGIRRRRRTHWATAGAVVTAVALTIAVVTTGSSSRRDRLVSPATPPAVANAFVGQLTYGGLTLRSDTTGAVTRVLVPGPPRTGRHDIFFARTLGPSGRFVYAFRTSAVFNGFDDAFAIKPASLSLVRIPVDGGPEQVLPSSSLTSGRTTTFDPMQMYPSPDDKVVIVMGTTRTATKAEIGDRVPVLLDVSNGEARALPIKDFVVGWLPGSHTVVTYNAPDPNKVRPADAPNPPVLLRTLDVSSGVSKPLADLGVNSSHPSAVCGSFVTTAVSPVDGTVAVVRDAFHDNAAGHCATNLPLVPSVTYIDPATGAVRAGPTLPPGLLTFDGATYTGTGVLILTLRTSDCHVGSQVIRIDGNRVRTLDAGRASC